LITVIGWWPIRKYADASFHAGPEREGPLEPGLFFVFLALLGKTTALRQGHAPDARPLGGLLALLRVESAVTGQELRRTSEALAVPLDALGQVRVLAAGFFEHLIAAYDAAVYLIYEHLASELPGFSDLACGE
jgi:hypothetical protein